MNKRSYPVYSVGSDPVQGRTLQELQEKQKGQSSVILIIIILVIVMAVMLSGGGAFLLSGNLPSPVSPTPTPVGGVDTTNPQASPSTSPSPAEVWTLNVTPQECTTEAGETKKKYDAIAQGQSGGYLSMEIQDSNGKYSVIATPNFVPQKTTYLFQALNSKGFNKQKWRINFFQGGNNNNGVWSGGILKATQNENPTGC